MFFVLVSLKRKIEALELESRSFSVHFQTIFPVFLYSIDDEKTKLKALLHKKIIELKKNLYLSIIFCNFVKLE